MEVGSLHVIGSKGLGGAERFFLRLTGALHEAGAPVRAVAPPGAVARELARGQVPWEALPMRGIWDLGAAWRLRRLAREGCPVQTGVVQTYMGRATRLTRLPRRGGPVHLARLGGYYDPAHYRHAHAWVANTRGIREHLLRAGFPAQRVFHIGNFVDPPAPPPPGAGEGLRRRLGIPPEARVLLALGRLHPNKGFADLLAALEALAADGAGRPVHLLLAGDGPLRAELEARARRPALAGRCHLLGWVGEPAACFAAAELLVCPSRHEPLGNVILEAWAHGLPVVATATAGPAEIAGQGQALLVPPGQPAALARALARVLEDEDLAGELAARGREAWEARHRREAVVGAYRELYRRLTGGG